MRVLGINDSHNATACLVENGEVIYAVQEERLNRSKNWSGFPKESILFILSQLNLKPTDIDYVAFNGESIPFNMDRTTHMAQVKEGETLSKILKKYVKRTFIKDIYDGFRDKKDRERRIDLVTSLGFNGESISFINHQMGHASAAYYGWGRFDEQILVLSNDGFGDDLCATVNIGHNGKIKKIAEIPGTESIGTLYSIITLLMGMVPLEHEYKIMGMAPYASKDASKRVADMFAELMVFDEKEPLVWKRSPNCPEINHAMEFFRELVSYTRFDHLCGGIQMFVEDMMVTWVRNCVKETGIKKVAMGGGVFMNVKANKLISEIPEIEEVFYFPSCGDESNAFGVAYHQYSIEKEKRGEKIDIQPFKNIYLGIEYTNEEILKALDEEQYKNKIVFKLEENINSKTADLLSDGKIVARFHGREEFGARSLGNRSILADPSKEDIVRTINEMIKCRDFWMPFAPASRAENASKYIKNPKNVFSPYMMMTYDSKDNRKEFFAGIQPYDFTCRMQMVTEEINASFYDLIGKFEERTGRGVLLNTSFNLHGFPITHTPQDAVEVLLNSGLEYLTVGDYVIQKA